MAPPRLPWAGSSRRTSKISGRGPASKVFWTCLVSNENPVTAPFCYLSRNEWRKCLFAFILFCLILSQLLDIQLGCVTLKLQLLLLCHCYSYNIMDQNNVSRLIIEMHFLDLSIRIIGKTIIIKRIKGTD